jgi:hypothetical protein
VSAYSGPRWRQTHPLVSHDFLRPSAHSLSAEIPKKCTTPLSHALKPKAGKTAMSLPPACKPRFCRTSLPRSAPRNAWSHYGTGFTTRMGDARSRARRRTIGTTALGTTGRLPQILADASGLHKANRSASPPSTCASASVCACHPTVWSEERRQ